jgi:hypothetical protein
MKCPVCNAGPFKSFRGLNRHMLGSPQCSLTNRPDLTTIANLDPPATQHPLSIPVAPLNMEGTESNGHTQRDSRPLDFPDSLMQMFIEEACAKNTIALPTFEDDTPLIEMDDEFNHFLVDPDPFPTTKPKIDTPSTVPLPDSVKENMFSPPTGFGPNYLKETLKENKGVHYAERMWEKMSPEEKSAISLLKILKGKEIGLFDQIMQWRWKSEQVYGHKVHPKSKPPTRSKCISSLMEVYGYHNLMPQEISIQLPKTTITTTMQRFPFGQMLASLLTDPVAMQPSNLCINIQDPFEVPPTAKKGADIGDFNTALLHRMAWERLCRGRQRRVLCEILLFMDKTHLDNNLAERKAYIGAHYVYFRNIQQSVQEQTRGMETHWLHSEFGPPCPT